MNVNVMMLIRTIYRKIHRALDADISDSFVMLMWTFIFTYAVSIVVTIFGCRSVLVSMSSNAESGYIGRIIEIIVGNMAPTTITFTVTGIVQTLPIVIRNQDYHLGWLLFEFVAAIVYIMIYVFGLQDHSIGYFIFSIISTVVILILSLYAFYRHCALDRRNVSDIAGENSNSSGRLSG